MSFTTSHSITLPYPIAQVSEKLTQLTPVIALSPLASDIHENSAQDFTFIENIPMIFGIVVKVHLTGSQVPYKNEEGQAGVLYTTKTDTGIAIHKTRLFVKGDNDTVTTVNEVIKCECPFLLKWIVQRECIKAHREHMNRFHLLFE